MKLNAIASQKLLSLVTEIEDVIGEPIPFDIVEKFVGNYKERAHASFRGKIPVIRIDKHHYKIDNTGALTTETECLIAHELLHVKCKQEGYPLIRLPELLWKEDNATQYLLAIISTIVEHSYVYTELLKLGYPEEEDYGKRLEDVLRKKTEPDYPESLQHIDKAFHFAETLLYHEYEPTLIEYLKINMPRTYDTTLQIVEAINKSKPLDPDSTRRAFIRLLRLVDKLCPSLRPPASKRFVLDLVVSERQLQLSARELIKMEYFNVKGISLLMFSSLIDGLYFAGLEDSKPIPKELIEDLKNSLERLTVKQFLEKYDARYTKR